MQSKGCEKTASIDGRPLRNRLTQIQSKTYGTELKEYIGRKVKPKTKGELGAAIIEFWSKVDRNKCMKYIGHLKKFIPKVIELNGAATGY